ncbi:unnamed protein product [Spirodela intermedia]|uniref:RIN4 pathogenic type III effector avirulence factor Avr cleavage site domain-containing protein n=1 Tax=Spirodela intermedia TaxID=51605 RepID=A0A7I8J4W8_SPIIN|nr:unnamed protein product [Spirodela intermedia]CAA6665131.1 unnamed protein product [Spirodela intermedia]
MAGFIHLLLLLLDNLNSGADGGGTGGGGWLSVPAFGDWDQKQDGVPDYSIDFSKIREMRKQNKKDLSRLSVGNDDELINPTAAAVGANHHVVGGASRPPPKKEKIMRYLNCCVSA